MKYHFNKENQMLTTRMENKNMSNNNLTDRRSLMNIILDLLELDPDSPENKTDIEKSLQKLSNKIESYQYFNFYLGEQKKQLEKEKKHLIKMIDQCKAIEDRLGECIKQALIIAGKSEIKSDNACARIYLKTTKSVKVLNVDALPVWARKEVPAELVPRKLEIADALKAGQVVDGAVLIENIYGEVSKLKGLKLQDEE